MTPKSPRIPVVIAAYNRPYALERLLGSLSRATYPPDTELIISIDGGGSENEEIRQLAEAFQWEHGRKSVRAHERNLGLRDHILQCGDIALENDGAILLEEDLFVSPAFYEYALEAYGFYSEDVNIAGISLYSDRYNESADLPFVPIDDGSDVFFMQLASSWGQLWSKGMWSQFRDWYERSAADIGFDGGDIPKDVANWPETSWKKYFIKYMVEEDKFFVYPRESFTTNFCEGGVHHTGAHKVFLVPLACNYRNKGLFVPMDESMARYDVYHELLESSMKKIAPHLGEFDFEVDLYGIKEPAGEKHWLTVKKSSRPLLEFGRELKPHEMNLVEEMPGGVINLSRLSDLEEGFNKSDEDDLLYFFNYKLRQTILKEKEREIRRKARQIEQKEQRLQRLSKELREKDAWLRQIHNGWSYRIGRCVTKPVEVLLRLLGAMK